MTIDPTRILIGGHSFIANLKSYIGRNLSADDLANRKPGLSWLMYDTQFRCLRQSHCINWDQLHTEFWVMAAKTLPFHPQRRQQQPFQVGHSFNQKRSQFLCNTCWIYNKVDQCNNTDCSYEHKCGLCHGRHCAKSCQTSNQRSTVA